MPHVSKNNAQLLSHLIKEWLGENCDDQGWLRGDDVVFTDKDVRHHMKGCHDDNRIHTNDAAARAAGFPCRIVPGDLILTSTPRYTKSLWKSLWTFLASQGMPAVPVYRRVNDVDSKRFVPVNDLVSSRVKIELADNLDRASGAPVLIIHLKVTKQVEEGKIVEVLTGKRMALLIPQPSTWRRLFARTRHFLLGVVNQQVPH